jgi:hypothetical protein
MVSGDFLEGSSDSYMEAGGVIDGDKGVHLLEGMEEVLADLPGNGVDGGDGESRGGDWDTTVKDWDKNTRSTAVTSHNVSVVSKI